MVDMIVHAKTGVKPDSQISHGSREGKVVQYLNNLMMHYMLLITTDKGQTEKLLWCKIMFCLFKKTKFCPVTSSHV